MSSKYWAVLTASIALAGCAVEVSNTHPVGQVAKVPQQSHRIPVSIGGFESKSTIKRALSSEELDSLSRQSQQLLMTHLRRSNRFQMVGGEHLGNSQQKPLLSAEIVLNPKVSYVITGDISEFGRKDLDDRRFFGLLGRSKSQVSYAKVNLYVVNASNSKVVYSVPGVAEQTPSDPAINSLGAAAGLAASLDNSVLELAIGDAVDRLVAAIDSGAWHPAK